MVNLRVECGGWVEIVEVVELAGMALLVIEPMAIEPRYLDLPWNPPLT